MANVIQRYSLSILLFCLTAFTTAVTRGTEIDSAKTNFVIFIADDMAWDDSGPYGNSSVRTPNLDRLAAEGMRFDRAYLTCSSCSPSRCSSCCPRGDCDAAKVRESDQNYQLENYA